MPVLGLVITLDDPSKQGRGLLLDRLLRERDVTIGDFEPEQGRLPVVLEATERNDGEARVRELAAIEGIGHIDVVFAHFEDLLTEPGQPQPDPRGDLPWT